MSMNGEQVASLMSMLQATLSGEVGARGQLADFCEENGYAELSVLVRNSQRAWVVTETFDDGEFNRSVDLFIHRQDALHHAFFLANEYGIIEHVDSERALGYLEAIAEDRLEDAWEMLLTFQDEVDWSISVYAEEVGGCKPFVVKKLEGYGNDFVMRDVFEVNGVTLSVLRGGDEDHGVDDEEEDEEEEDEEEENEEGE